MFEHMINSLCLICGSWHKNLSIAIQCSAFSCTHYSNAACGYIPMSTSETWKNNNILKNFSENLNIFIQENALEVIVWKTIYHNLKSRGTRYFLSEYSMKCTLCFLYFLLCFLVDHQFLVVSCDLFTHILLGCFTNTGVIIWLPQCQGSNLEEYG